MPGEVRGGVVGPVFGAGLFGEDFGFPEGLFEGGAAGGLQGVKTLFVALDPAGDALFIEGEQGEFFGGAPEGPGLGEGGVDLGVFGDDVGVGGTVSEGEDVVFDGAGAVQTPFVFGDGLGDLGFESAFGRVGLADVGGEAGEDGQVFVRHGGDLTGEAVTPGVERGADLAGFRFRAGGVLGVAAVGVDLFLRGGHVVLSFAGHGWGRPNSYAVRFSRGSGGSSRGSFGGNGLSVLKSERKNIFSFCESKPDRDCL